MMEESVSREIARISERVKGERAFTSLLQTKDPRVQLFMEKMAELTDKQPGEIDEFLATVWRNLILGEPTSKIARSETLANDEERKQISDHADSIRVWLWDKNNGRAPIDEDTDTVDETRRIWNDGRFSLIADEKGSPKNQELHAIDPALLFIEENDPTQNARVAVAMGFDDTYYLGIFYDEEGKDPHYYGSSIRPINEMVSNEAIIISGVLNDIIKSQRIIAE